MSKQDLGSIKDFFKREIENGTYFLHHEEVFQVWQQALAEKAKNGGWDQELEGLSCEILAGLAVYHPHAYRKEFEAVIQDSQISEEGKMKALHVIRHHFLDPDHASSCLRLYKMFLESPHPGLKDFAARSFMQLLTEMRVGGQITSVLSKDDSRKEIENILKSLSGEGWVEADELLDFLEF